MKPSHSAGPLTWDATGWVYRGESLLATLPHDVEDSFTCTVSSRDDNVDYVYRADPANPGNCYILRVRRVSGAPSFVRYHSATALASSNLSAATSFNVRVKTRGARHEVWFNKMQMPLSTGGPGHHAGWPKTGLVEFNANGAGTVSNYVSHLGYPAVLGAPMFREDQLLGINDFADEWSLGCHTLNHPSILGHRVYARAFDPLLKAMGRIASRPKPAAVVKTVSKTDIALVPSDYIEALIGSVAPAAQSIVTGSSVTIDLRVNASSLQYVETLTFPYVATWLVRLVAEATSHNGTNRSTLSASAIEVQA